MVYRGCFESSRTERFRGFKSLTLLEEIMPTRKLADLPRDKICHHPDHNPPSMMVFPPGHYQHVCSGCGHTRNFTVRQKVTMEVVKHQMMEGTKPEPAICTRPAPHVCRENGPCNGFPKE